MTILISISQMVEIYLKKIQMFLIFDVKKSVKKKMKSVDSLTTWFESKNEKRSKPISVHNKTVVLAHLIQFSSVSFHIETSHLIFKVKQMTGFYMKWNTGLKWVYFITEPNLFHMDGPKHVLLSCLSIMIFLMAYVTPVMNILKRD